MFNKTIKILITTLILFIFLLFGNYFYISNSTKNQIHDELYQLPRNEVGLLLGTSILTRDGRPNQFFINRISAAVELYNNNKIEYIIVSGDNSTYSYNEPLFMKRSLIEKGIPAEKIITDFAGFRTLDSVIRSNKVFGQNNITIISQKFHNQRAIFIANYNNINAIAYNAKDVPFSRSPRIYIREVLSRANASFEKILKKQPKFLGEPIQIP